MRLFFIVYLFVISSSNADNVCLWDSADNRIDRWGKA